MDVRPGPCTDVAGQVLLDDDLLVDQMLSKREHCCGSSWRKAAAQAPIFKYGH
jgi:hypothetical protein